MLKNQQKNLRFTGANRCQPVEWLDDDDVFFGPPKITTAKMVVIGSGASVPRGTFSPKGCTEIRGDAA